MGVTKNNYLKMEVKMRTLITLLVALFLMVIGPIPNSSAQDMVIDGHGFWFHGTVEDSNGNPISGVTVRCSNCLPALQTTTDGNGEWDIGYHNYCGYKDIYAFGEGWEEVRKRIYDNSCPECCLGDPICEGQAVCAWDRLVNFTLNPDNNQDIDNDGLANALDNCPNKPNWISLGTCTYGKRGQLCTHHDQCDKCGIPDGYCSKLQEDCDGNGIGDACDVCVTQTDGCSNCNNITAQGSHKVLAEMNVTQMSNNEVRTMWYIISDMWWTGHNATSYPTIAQAIAGRFNGPDRLCDECVHDYNENGICDEDEPGGLPLAYSLNPRLMLQSLIDAYQYCVTVKLPNCDPEEDPWGCMW